MSMWNGLGLLCLLGSFRGFEPEPEAAARKMSRMERSMMMMGRKSTKMTPMKNLTQS